MLLHWQGPVAVSSAVLMSLWFCQMVKAALPGEASEKPSLPALVMSYSFCARSKCNLRPHNLACLHRVPTKGAFLRNWPALQEKLGQQEGEVKRLAVLIEEEQSSSIATPDASQLQAQQKVASAEEEVSASPSRAFFLVTGCLGRILGAADVCLMVAGAPHGAAEC